MKTKLFWIILSSAALLSGCSFSIGTGANTANTPANAPAANAPAKAPAASPEAQANTAKTPEPAKPASKGDDPKSETENIQFAKGTTEATLDRTIAPGVNKMYMFNAKKGQHVSLEVTEDTGELEVDFNKEHVELGENYSQQLNASGDWAIYVNNPGKKTLKYKLSIGIQ